MRTVEIRRHTMRHKPGKHLTQDGVTLARRVGEGMGPFDRVVASHTPRAFETAIAMGFAVDARDDLAEAGPGWEDEVDWTAGFGAIAAAARRGGDAGRFARRLAAALRAIAEAVPEGGSALVISHGGIIEAATAGCLPEMDLAAWGGSCHFCEGVRLRYDGGRFVGGEALRLPEALRLLGHDDRIPGGGA